MIDVPHPVRRATIGGALAGASLAIGVLAAEAVAAVRREYIDPDRAPSVEGRFGESTGQDLRLVILGDSTGAGTGVSVVAETVGGQLAQRLARSGWRVQLAGVAVSGSRCRDLGPQVSRALLTRPDLAVILVGVNDALWGASLASIRRDLGAAVARLHAARVGTVVGTCPDLGAARALAQPLRSLAGWRGRAVAAEQAHTALAAGGAAVDIGLLTGPIFRADRGTLSGDRFHPSADGYRLWAEALHPTVASAAAAWAATS